MPRFSVIQHLPCFSSIIVRTRISQCMSVSAKLNFEYIDIIMLCDHDIFRNQINSDVPAIQGWFVAIVRCLFSGPIRGMTHSKTAKAVDFKAHMKKVLVNKFTCITI